MMPRAVVAAQPRVSERAFQADVISLARMLGYEARTDNATNAPRRCPRCQGFIHLPRNAPGWPDLTLWRPGSRDRLPRFILAELKVKGGSLKLEQVTTIATLRLAGVEVYIWWNHLNSMAEIADVLGADRRQS